MSNEKQEYESLEQLNDDRLWIARLYKHWASSQKLEKKRGRPHKRFPPEIVLDVYFKAAEGNKIKEIVSCINLSKGAFYNIIQAQTYSPEGEHLKEALERGRALGKSKVGGLIAYHRFKWLQVVQAIHERYPEGEVFSMTDEEYAERRVHDNALGLLLQYVKLVEGIDLMDT